MRADIAEVSWDTNKAKWLVRVTIGEEVIRRYSDLSRNAAEQELREAAWQVLQDEGYEMEGTDIKIQQPRVA